VCWESYKVAAKAYSLVFGTKEAFPSTWFNFEEDTLYLDWGWQNWHAYKPTDFLEGEAIRVRHLAIDGEVSLSSDSRPDQLFDQFLESRVADILLSFPNLKTLTINAYPWDAEDPQDFPELVFTEALPIDKSYHCEVCEALNKNRDENAQGDYNVLLPR